MESRLDGSSCNDVSMSEVRFAAANEMYSRSCDDRLRMEAALSVAASMIEEQSTSEVPPVDSPVAV